MSGQSVTFTATVAVVAPGDGNADRDGDVQEWRSDAGQRHARRRRGDLHHDDADGRQPFDHRGLRRRFQRFDQHVRPLTQTVNKDSTTTTLTSSANPSVSGQSVTFTATVAVRRAGDGNADRDGDVQGRRNDAGRGRFWYRRRRGDHHDPTGRACGRRPYDHRSLRGRYQRFGQHVVPADRAVIQGSTTTTLTSSTAPAVPGQSVTFSATVAVQRRERDADRHGDLRRRTTALGNPVPVSTTGGVTTALSWSALSVGDDTITAVYSGDTDDQGSTSNPLAQTVTQATTSFTGLTPSQAIFIGTASIEPGRHPHQQ